MTIAVIVACKDSFYMISDTLSSGGDHFSLNSKKAFFSKKHKVGMCIAGQAELRFDGAVLDQILHIDYVLNRFFVYLDTLDTFSVRDMTEQLLYFMKNNYSLYYDCFTSKVSYFYGGFINNPDGTKMTAIYCHNPKKHNDNLTEEKYQDSSYFYDEKDEKTPPFFANTNAIKKYIDLTLKLPDATKNITLKDFITKPNFRKHFLEFTIPYACLAINKEHPHTIGNYLSYLSFTPDALPHNTFMQYHGKDMQLEKCHQMDPLSIPPYMVHRSYKESNEAFLKGELIKYFSINGKPIPVSMPDLKPRQEKNSHSHFAFFKAHPYITVVGAIAILLFINKKLKISSNLNIDTISSPKL